MATIEELLTYGKERLEQSGNEYAKYERKVLLEEVLQCNYMYMLMNGTQEVSVSEERQYRDLIEKRCTHYPLQYILGNAHFMDYTFFVNENVLIPRNDTEVLVETADELIKKVSEERPSESSRLRILDLCCGSGCIGISLKLYHPDICLVLSDFSAAALEVTKKNLAKYDLKAEILQGDLLEHFSGKADFIISNPPYIERSVIGTLMPEVREHEPMSALDGGEDGLDFYRRIVADAPAYLNEQGYLMFEIGHNQGEAVSSMMREKGFLEVAVTKDYAGLDRVVCGHL
jgi:release factor glutamine methyltransferase